MQTYSCPVCGFSYREVADKCEDWCEQHSSCNLDTIKHAIKPKGKSI